MLLRNLRDFLRRERTVVDADVIHLPFKEPVRVLATVGLRAMAIVTKGTYVHAVRYGIDGDAERSILDENAVQVIFIVLRSVIVEHHVMPRIEGRHRSGGNIVGIGTVIHRV